MVSNLEQRTSPPTAEELSDSDWSIHSSRNERSPALTRAYVAHVKVMTDNAQPLLSKNAAASCTWWKFSVEDERGLRVSDT